MSRLHSAADNLWRSSGNLLLAQQRLRHESVATTQMYLHPTRDDLTDALARLQVVRLEETETESKSQALPSTHDNVRYVKLDRERCLGKRFCLCPNPTLSREPRGAASRS